MKKISFILLTTVSILFLGCSSTDCGCKPLTNNYQNKVLVLKVDYITNVFEGGKGLTFATTSTFTIQKLYMPPSDFGWIKLNYQELNLPIFDGSIHWMGMGTIAFPTDFSPASSFSYITTIAPIPMPAAGFENLHNPSNSTIDYTLIWNSISNLEKVDEYRTLNPTSTIKIFLYTPDVGIGNPANWKWIVLVKN